MSEIFFNAYGRLRSGWRLTIYLLLLIVLSIVLEQIVRTLYGFISTYRSIPHPEFLLSLAFRGGLLVLALGVGYLCAHFLEELPWERAFIKVGSEIFALDPLLALRHWLSLSSSH
jgi:hypothetical protein